MASQSTNNPVGLLSDKEIVDGLRRRDEAVTRDYFYPYCLAAYRIYNHRYALSSKPELDFYSLAHEYYLALDRRHFDPLEQRRRGVSLRTWMIGGFRYVMLDRLKACYNHLPTVSLDDMLAAGRLDFAPDDDGFMNRLHSDIDDYCNTYLRHDPRGATLLRMVFIEGYKGKDVAARLQVTPAAVSQRLHKLMEEQLMPYLKRSLRPDYAQPTDVAVEAGERRRMERPAAPSGLFTGFIQTSSIFMDQQKETLARQSAGRITPSHITRLAEGEIFVFGSNLQGMHGGGAALTAWQQFGAEMGRGAGRQGSSYGIPTMQGGVETIRPYTRAFLDYARRHPELTFLVTPIGCGIAGFSPREIAPLFADAVRLPNVHLPQSFWDVLGNLNDED